VPETDHTGHSDWHPTASLEILRLRATLTARIRSEFRSRGVLEVDTPLLSRYATTDPALDIFETAFCGPGQADPLPLYLQTSPEFFMKRLLAAGSGPIYQISHVFRNQEFGSRHNPEFTMLEWYRPGIDYQQLMDDVDSLLEKVLEGVLDYRPARRIRYRDWFIEYTGLDPWRDNVAAFSGFAQEQLGALPRGLDADRLDPWLDFLVTHWLEPRLGEGAVFVYDYPASQASLAKIRDGEVPVAERFELYLDGRELANGFSELVDAEEQQQRFENDNRERQRDGRQALPADRKLVAALRHGLPECSGVALGFDRLVMLAAGIENIAGAIPFGFAAV
jgi:lysyl-tRNA synthetase class 2